MCKYKDWLKTPLGIKWLDITNLRVYSKKIGNVIDLYDYYNNTRIYYNIEDNIENIFFINDRASVIAILSVMRILHKTIFDYYCTVFSQIHQDYQCYGDYSLTNILCNLYKRKDIPASWYILCTTAQCNPYCYCWYVCSKRRLFGKVITVCPIHSSIAIILDDCFVGLGAQRSLQRNNKPFDVDGYNKLLNYKNTIDIWLLNIILTMHGKLTTAFEKNITTRDIFRDITYYLMGESRMFLCNNQNVL